MWRNVLILVLPCGLFEECLPPGAVVKMSPALMSPIVACSDFIRATAWRDFRLLVISGKADVFAIEKRTSFIVLS